MSRAYTENLEISRGAANPKPFNDFADDSALRIRGVDGHAAVGPRRIAPIRRVRGILIKELLSDIEQIVHGAPNRLTTVRHLGKNMERRLRILGFFLEEFLMLGAEVGSVVADLVDGLGIEDGSKVCDVVHDLMLSLTIDVVNSTSGRLTCERCGLIVDRDGNAARTILAAAGFNGASVEEVRLRKAKATLSVLS